MIVKFDTMVLPGLYFIAQIMVPILVMPAALLSLQSLLERRNSQSVDGAPNRVGS